VLIPEWFSRFEELSMEPTPDTSPAKRTRAKPKVVAKDPVETKAAAGKKPRAPRKTPIGKATAKPAADSTMTAEVQIVAATPDLTPARSTASSPARTPEDVSTMIATAAYYLAAARNFSPGHELDDWLEAERAVHARIFG
jgi:hypothetical protein